RSSMLARKISASRGASAARNGRNARAGCARAIIVLAPCPLAGGARKRDRDSERISGSSHHLPGGRAVLVIFQDHTMLSEIVTDAVGLGKILGLAGGIAGVDQLLDVANLT